MGDKVIYIDAEEIVTNPYFESWNYYAYVSVSLCFFVNSSLIGFTFFPISADVVRGINNRQFLTLLPNKRHYGTKCRHSIRSAHLTSHLHLCTTVKYITNFQLLLLLLLSASTSSPSSLSSSSSSSPSLPCQ